MGDLGLLDHPLDFRQEVRSLNPLDALRPSPDDEFSAPYLVLLVEGTIFRVPRSVFHDSHIFADMFSVPPPPNTPVDGSSAEHPLRLEGVTRDEIKVFLRLFLPPRFDRSLPQLPKEAWLAILRLAGLWDMPHVRALALDELASYIYGAPREMLALADAHGVPDWAARALSALVDAPAPPDAEDLAALGPARLLILVALRESRLAADAASKRLALRRAWAPACACCRPMLGDRPVYRCEQCNARGTLIEHPGIGEGLDGLGKDWNTEREVRKVFGLKPV